VISEKLIRIAKVYFLPVSNSYCMCDRLLSQFQLLYALDHSCQAMVITDTRTVGPTVKIIHLWILRIADFAFVIFPCTFYLFVLLCVLLLD